MSAVHRHVVIISVPLPDHPQPTRIVGVLVHEDGIPYAVLNRIETGTAAVLPDKLHLDPRLLRSRRNDELGVHYVYVGDIAVLG